MKVLIDECAPKVMKVELAASGSDCATVEEAGWSVKENGELLALADASFDGLVTIDRNLRYRLFRLAETSGLKSGKVILNDTVLKTSGKSDIHGTRIWKYCPRRVHASLGQAQQLRSAP
jgi:hypothetical protein